MKIQTILTLFAMIPSLLTEAKPIEVGQPAPSLVAINQDAQSVDLGETFASGITLIFFYPRAETPGCTAQACSLRDSFHELVAKGVKVYGVSNDKAERQKAFKERNLLPFDLIADHDKAVSKAFGRRWLSRQAYLIHDGNVVWRDLKASTSTQAADVKTALEGLGLATFAP